MDEEKSWVYTRRVSIVKAREGVMRQNQFSNRFLYVLVLFGTLLFLSGSLLVQAQEEEVPEEAASEQSEEDASEQTDLYNILLIGSDRRDDSWIGNSDVIILITINSDTQKIIMTSFMRDLYADIPGYGVHKLNYAYAAGGASTLIETLEESYDLQIDNYAAVDFDGMAQIIDLIGGVDMEISDEEADLVNGYLESMEQYGDNLNGGGTYHLDGYQAVAYMRIRYVGNGDYERTQRQRNVLSAIFSSLSDKNMAQLIVLGYQVLSIMDDDFSAWDVISLMTSLRDVKDYTLTESRIPYDDLYSSENGMLVPDFEATKERLREELYE